MSVLQQVHNSVFYWMIKNLLIFLLVSADLAHQDEEPASDLTTSYAKLLSEGLV